MKKILSNSIANRRVDVLGRGKSITLMLGKPKKEINGDWKCSFLITGLGTPKVQFGYGVDSMQALLMAIEGMRVTLERSGERIAWAGVDDSSGLPRPLPTYFGSAFAKKVGRMIDNEIEKFALKAQKKSSTQKKKTIRKRKS